ncbi:DUF4178 domain-containing protein [Chitinophaga sp. 30R24]|uniref:DUF4178 domain-containing protein n=1 Tax=Chitinophaga sp. 30R24 TaxID=3248838 RepID=UPI003B8F8213
MPSLPAIFNCLTCGEQHVLFNASSTVVYVCGQCNGVITQNANGWHSTSVLKPAKGKLLITPGATGVLRGKQYIVVTATERYETASTDYWTEYTLMRKEDHALAFLSTYNGHWNLMEPLEEKMLPTDLIENPDQPTVVWNGKKFERFSRYYAKYQYANGEFHWENNMQRGVQCVEYIHPPYLLVIEYEKKAGGEKDIFGGEYISRKEVSDAFCNGITLPARTGVAPAQPFPLPAEPRRFLVGTLVFCILAFIIQSIYNHHQEQRQVFSQQFFIDDSTANKPIVTPSFTLNDRTSNMEVTINSDVNNNWCEAAISLVNEQNGKEAAFEVGASYYSGVSDGDYWSEGEKVQKEFVCSVPPGTYHFVITPTKEATGPPVSFNIIVYWDVPTFWNAVVLSLVLAVLAAVLYWAKRSFEQQRWEESNVNNNFVI